MKSVMIIVAIVTVLVGALLVGTASAQPSWIGAHSAPLAQTIPTPTPVPTLAPGNIYTVQHGDTLSSIATGYKVSLFEIARVNYICDPGLIITGQRLLIPLGFPQYPMPIRNPGPVCAPGFPCPPAYNWGWNSRPFDGFYPGYYWDCPVRWGVGSFPTRRW